MPRTWTGAEIVALRDRLGWTQRELARHIGVTIPTVCRWERGHRCPHPICRKALDRIATNKRFTS